MVLIAQRQREHILSAAVFHRAKSGFNAVVPPPTTSFSIFEALSISG